MKPAQGERALAIATLLAIPLIAPFCNLHWAGPWASPLLLCSGLLLCWALFAHVLGRLSEWLARFADGVRLGALLGIGVVAQVVVAVLTAPIPVSDFYHYSYIARQIAAGLPYVDEFGRRALLPPGWPLTFAPFTRIFGPPSIASRPARHSCTGCSSLLCACRRYGAGRRPLRAKATPCCRSSIHCSPARWCSASSRAATASICSLSPR